MTQKEIAASLESYGVTADTALCGQIETYIELLLSWNRKVSLTAIRDPQQIVRFHFGESLFAINAVPVKNGRLADVGSGAGFPGIPLAMACSGLQVTLIEANQKKAAFLGEASRALHLTNVSVVRKRLEDIEVGTSGFDFVTARALGSHEILLDWATRSLVEGGKLVFWLGKDDAQNIRTTVGWRWESPIAIPMSMKRVLLVGTLENC